MTTGNPAFCLFLYLTGVQFRSELLYVGDVSEQKIKYWPIRTWEVVGVRLYDGLYVKDGFSFSQHVFNTNVLLLWQSFTLKSCFVLSLNLPAFCKFIKKEPLVQVFSCEFCEISDNNFLHRTSLVAASVY